ncbi:MAG: hypothetical protein ACO1SX_20345 [Actinomycetota bacterium]
MLETGVLTRAAQAVEAKGQNVFQLRATREWRDIGTLGCDFTEVAPQVDGDAYEPETARASWLEGANRARALIATGLLLVVFSGPLSTLLVPKFQMGDMQGWDPAAAKDLAEMLRLLGVLVFVAGLVERLILGITTAFTANSGSR